MPKAPFAFVLCLGLCSLAAPTAFAGPSLSDAWFVRARESTAQAMIADRTECVHDAEQFGVDRASDFSNPEYGSLTALGAALDEDALHGGAKQAVRRAVRDACMSKRGWTRLDPSEDEVKVLKKASARRPEALDAWLRANADKAPKPEAKPSGPAAAAKAAPTADQPVVDAGKLQEVTPPPAEAAAPAQTSSDTAAAGAGEPQDAKPAESPAPRA